MKISKPDSLPIETTGFIQHHVQQAAPVNGQAAEIASAMVIALRQMGVLPKQEEAPPFTPPDVVLHGDDKRRWLEQQPSACRCDACVELYHVNVTKGRLTGKGLHWRCAGCGAQIGMSTRPTMVHVSASRDAKDLIGVQFCSAAWGAGVPKGPLVDTVTFDATGRPATVN